MFDLRQFRRSTDHEIALSCDFAPVSAGDQRGGTWQAAEHLVRPRKVEMGHVMVDGKDSGEGLAHAGLLAGIANLS